MKKIFPFHWSIWSVLDCSGIGVTFDGLGLFFVSRNENVSP